MATTVGIVLRVPSIGIAKSKLVGTLGKSENGMEPLIHEGRTVGYAARFGSSLRYWSPGYSVNLSELRAVLGRYGHICLNALAESHRLARREVRKRRD
jgi:deoxyinosine 3'endonuclease (endonuclease V)